MQSRLAERIRDELQRYADGVITLQEFARWFMPATWNVHQLGDTEAEQLTADIGLHLAECERGHWSEPQTREYVRDLLAGTARGSAPPATR